MSGSPRKTAIQSIFRIRFGRLELIRHNRYLEFSNYFNFILHYNVPPILQKVDFLQNELETENNLNTSYNCY